MKKGLLVILSLIIGACKTESDENFALKKTLPKIKDISKDLNFIFTNGFWFTEDLKIDKIGVERDDDRFKIYYFVSDRGHLENLKGLNIAFRVYPKDSKLFKSKMDQKAKTISSKCELLNMGGSLVIKTEEFSLETKKLNQSKVFFYESDTGVVGKMMTILDLDFDF